MNTTQVKKPLILVIFLYFSQILLANPVIPGVEVFNRHYSQILKGQRVGVLTNHTGIDRAGNSTIDLLVKNPNVKVTCLFAPEHGLRGRTSAGKEIKDGRDQQTGLPVFSLYIGDDRRPKGVELELVDTIICDLQDTGCRSYTYIWTIAEVIRACGASGKKVIILDRPNPLGGNVVDGPVVAKEYRSFIGLYPVPRIYGMTIGELCLYLNFEHRLNCHLTVIPMHNYKRGMTYNETKLPWVNPSPNIRNINQLSCFGATGSIGTLGGTLSIGFERGLLFQSVAAPWIDAKHMTVHLNKLKLPGIKFSETHYMRGRSTKLHGVSLQVTDPSKFFPVTTEIMILGYLRRNYPKKPFFRASHNENYDKAMGTDKVRLMLVNGYSEKQIINSWQKSRQQFLLKRKKYLIYR